MAPTQDLELQLQQLQEQQQLILQQQEQLFLRLQGQLSQQHRELRQQLLQQLTSTPPRTASRRDLQRASKTKRNVSIHTLRSAGWNDQQIATHLCLQLWQVQRVPTTIHDIPRHPSGRPPLPMESQVEESIKFVYASKRLREVGGWLTGGYHRNEVGTARSMLSPVAYDGPAWRDT
ncbi:hypothetical protein MRS44_017708 [Fusarium solani]|uniref:uncharacterized protein n=1 Tax=Fusarium solani TaxID=169388 RepID=UPI0032C4A740|nr:hypothetical protein MRS44_017708 [Fusarium solani]